MNDSHFPDYHYTILERDLDTFGHVNNATYLTIFEEARWKIITDNGYGLEAILKCRKGPVVLDVQMQFLKELRLREQVKIRSVANLNENRTGGMIQEMIKDDGSVACRAKFVFGLFDLDRRRLVMPTPEWRRALGMPERNS